MKAFLSTRATRPKPQYLNRIAALSEAKHILAETEPTSSGWPVNIEDLTPEGDGHRALIETLRNFVAE